MLPRQAAEQVLEDGSVPTTPYRDSGGSPIEEEVLRSLPRPPRLEIVGEEQPDRRREPVFAQASRTRIFLRLQHWIINLLRFMWRSLVDRFKGRTDPKHFGIRLRRLFEDMGGTAIKVGQQLSVRIDLFPLPVCHELAALRDKVPPFPIKVAIDTIEKAMGARRGLPRVPLREIFRHFDPQPIGSASIACVYQAVLHTGERVAVKVRRPKVKVTFGADIGVLEVATKALEIMAIVRPGFFKNLRVELRSMLEQELDFTSEARFQRLFRRYTKKDNIDWLTAPRIYTDYCTQDVMVSEFVEGVWCDQIVRAHEMGDQDALSKLAAMGITPKKLGKRLMHYSFWSRFEALFFHSDPHPGNILVQPGCKIVMVDFGSCGTTSRKARMNQMMMIERTSYNDVSGTVEAAVATLEPLPHIDVYELKKEIEAHFWNWLFAFRDKEAEWWERTTAGIWFALLEITRKRQIPVGLETLRLARSLLLIDTLCFELYPQMVSPDEFHKYMRRASRRAARRVYKKIEKRPLSSFADEMLSQVDEVVSRGRFMAWQAERFVDSMPNEFAASVKKGAYVASVVVQVVLAAVGLGVGISLYVRFWHHKELSGFGGAFEEFGARVLFNPITIIALLALMWSAGRRIWFRLRDLDVGD